MLFFYEVAGEVTLDVDVLDLSDESEEIRKTILSTNRSRLLVQDGDADSIIGVVAIKDIIGVFANGLPLELRRFVQPVPVVMDHADALDVVRLLRPFYELPVYKQLIFSISEA